jgi:hypothetical protein
MGSCRKLSRIISYDGAPRLMKMGTIASPWRYDGMCGSIIARAVPRG